MAAKKGAKKGVAKKSGAKRGSAKKAAKRSVGGSGPAKPKGFPPPPHGGKK